MAYTSREIEAPPSAVWAALVDPRTYPRWLVGTVAVRAVDDEWPAPGSAFHHSVGIGSLVLRDHTTVVEVEPERLLVLKVRARPVISAVARFDLVADDGRTVVRFEEEPYHRVIGNLARPVMDPFTHVRNHVSLERLERYVTERVGPRPLP